MVLTKFADFAVHILSKGDFPRKNAERRLAISMLFLGISNGRHWGQTRQNDKTLQYLP